MYSAKICTFNLDQKVLSEIKKQASIVYDGAIGKRIKIPNNRRDDVHYCLLNLDFPENFQEHQIFIIDLTKKIQLNIITKNTRENTPLVVQQWFFKVHIQKIYLTQNL